MTGTLKTANSSGRKGTYYLPDGYQGRALPAAVLLHGSGSSGSAMVALFKSLADTYKFIIIAPDSVKPTYWMAMRGTYYASEDETHVERCLAEVKKMTGVKIASNRVLLAGFSGALAACRPPHKCMGGGLGWGAAHTMPCTESLRWTTDGCSRACCLQLSLAAPSPGSDRIRRGRDVCPVCRPRLPLLLSNGNHALSLGQ